MKNFFLLLALATAGAHILPLNNTAQAQNEQPKQFQFLTYSEFIEINRFDDREAVEDKLYSAMTGHVTFCRLKNEEKETVFLKSCRQSKLGCEGRMKVLSGLIVDAAEKHDIDPFLIAAIAYHESRFNPFAVSSKRAKGIMQVNARSKRVRGVPFFKSKKFWEKCKHSKTECQAEVLAAALIIFKSSLEECHNDVDLAFGMYNSGKCIKRRYYTKSVKRSYESLLNYNGRNYLKNCDSVAEDQKFWERKLESQRH